MGEHIENDYVNREDLEHYVENDVLKEEIRLLKAEYEA